MQDSDASLQRGPVVVRRRLGAALKRLRSQHGLPLDVVARRLEISTSKLSRLETGQIAPKIRDVRDLLEIYSAPAEERDRLLQWAGEAKQPGWWQGYTDLTNSDIDLYVSLEAEARQIKNFCLPVAGLLQTESYVRSLLTGVLPQASPDEVDKLVEMRIRRQAILQPSRGDHPPVELHVVMDESALHRANDRAIMREQLEMLLERSTQPNITINMLPFTAGWTPAFATFSIFEPRHPDDSRVVNVESTGQDAYFEGPAELTRYDEIWTNVLSCSLDPEQTRTQLDQALRMWR
jgi:transcriptional regulator with XRE-family HTH domain